MHLHLAQETLGEMVLSRILNIALFLFIVLAGMALVLLGPVRVVVSDSMVPTFRAGDALWIRPISGPITPGMVVSYQLERKLITHRVVSVEGNTLRTKGDNNQEVDPWVVPVSSVVGTPVIHIPYLGYAIAFLRQPIVWLLLILTPAGLIIAGEVKKINSALHSPRSPDRSGERSGGEP